MCRYLERANSNNVILSREEGIMVYQLDAVGQTEHCYLTPITGRGTSIVIGGTGG